MSTQPDAIIKLRLAEYYLSEAKRTLDDQKRNYAPLLWIVASEQNVDVWESNVAALKKKTTRCPKCSGQGIVEAT